jgi:hypothetical protein
LSSAHFSAAMPSRKRELSATASSASSDATGARSEAFSVDRTHLGSGDGTYPASHDQTDGSVSDQCLEVPTSAASGNGTVDYAAGEGNNAAAETGGASSSSWPNPYILQYTDDQGRVLATSAAGRQPEVAAGAGDPLPQGIGVTNFVLAADLVRTGQPITPLQGWHWIPIPPTPPMPINPPGPATPPSQRQGSGLYIRGVAETPTHVSGRASLRRQGEGPPGASSTELPREGATSKAESQGREGPDGHGAQAQNVVRQQRRTIQACDEHISILRGLLGLPFGRPCPIHQAEEYDPLTNQPPCRGWIQSTGPPGAAPAAPNGGEGATGQPAGPPAPCPVGGGIGGPPGQPPVGGWPHPEVPLSWRQLPEVRAADTLAQAQARARRHMIDEAVRAAADVQARWASIVSGALQAVSATDKFQNLLADQARSVAYEAERVRASRLAAQASRRAEEAERIREEDIARGDDGYRAGPHNPEGEADPGGPGHEPREGDETSLVQANIAPVAIGSAQRPIRVPRVQESARRLCHICRKWIDVAILRSIGFLCPECDAGLLRTMQQPPLNVQDQQAISRLMECPTTSVTVTNEEAASEGQQPAVSVAGESSGEQGQQINHSGPPCETWSAAAWAREAIAEVAEVEDRPALEIYILAQINLARLEGRAWLKRRTEGMLL